jgi:uncharacterized protein
MPKFSDSDGERAVKAARTIVEGYVKHGDVPAIDVPESFHNNGGVFVTLKTYPGDDLRGCIGYPEPVAPLEEALTDSAVSAATRDPRFRPVREKELPLLLVEVSLLTPPEPIIVSNPKELLGKIVIGEDGLIAERGRWRGLLLPQVPVELGWGVQEFLMQTCEKAGLEPEAWKDPKTKFSKFQAEVFSEESPNGKIHREILRG